MKTPASPLTDAQIQQLAQRMAARKSLLLGEVQDVTQRSEHDLDVDLISRTGNIGNVATSALQREIAQGEIERDIEEIRDIVAAEQRIARSTYGECVDCGVDIGFKRLDAYPTAKRCFDCQVAYEKGRRG